MTLAKKNVPGPTPAKQYQLLAVGAVPTASLDGRYGGWIGASHDNADDPEDRDFHATLQIG